MPIARLQLRLLLAITVPALLGWWCTVTFFAADEAHRASLHRELPLGFLALALVASGVLWLLAGPLRRAGSRRDEDPDDAQVERGRRDPGRTVAAALRLPGRLSASVVALSLALVAAVVVLRLHEGAPPDLAVAGAAAGVAFALMAGMLTYSLAVPALAPLVAELGAVELRQLGTLRARVLVVCFGLLAIGTLLVGAVAYARHRAELDDAYLQGGLRAQDLAARSVGPRGAAAAVELAFAAAGAPTAALAPDGRVLARAGDDGGRLARAAPEPGAAVERVPGGWLLRRGAAGALLVSWLPDPPTRDLRHEFWTQALALFAALLAAAGLVVWLAAASVTAPVASLKSAAHRIAEGDLTVSPPSLSRDEMGQLAADFRRMAQALRALVTDVQAASGGVGEGTREMGEIGARVRGGARQEHDRVLAVQAAVEAMQGSVALVGRGVDGLAEYVHSTGAAVGEMAAALEEVRRLAAELERRIGAAGADVERLSEAGRRAQTQLGALDGVAGRAQGTLAGVSASLAGLETSAISSQLAAAQAAELADHAEVVVHETVEGMESLRGAVGDAKKRVTALGRRSDDIDQILDFVGEVAGRTNLLSLNASIIATQAGEHGKAFGVVADQIRELASQISSSTKSIGQIIRAVRDDVAGTARLIDRGDELASAGVTQARRSLGALQEIRTATARGHETAAVIRDAVQVHAHSTRDVSELVSSVTESSRALSEAVEMVSRSVAAVGALSRGAGALADQVSGALEEQSGLGRRQLESLERIDAMLADITRAVANHDAATRRVRDALGHLTRSAEQQESVVVELSGVADRLGGRSRALADRVGRFKI